jgi:hypothetical protein
MPLEMHLHLGIMIHLLVKAMLLAWIKRHRLEAIYVRLIMRYSLTGLLLQDLMLDAILVVKTGVVWPNRVRDGGRLYRQVSLRSDSFAQHAMLQVYF